MSEVVFTATRMGTALDAECVAYVQEATWSAAYSGLIPHAQLREILATRSPSWWRGVLSGNHTVILAEFGSRIVGYASVGANRTPELPQDGELYEVYVMPEYQGMGIGRTLLEDARLLLNSFGMKGMVAWVCDDCANALEFMHALGGRPVAAAPEFFGERQLPKTAFAWA